MTKGKTIDEFNFIRAISALGIVIYHFINEIGQTRLLIGNYPWGSIFVTVFFMVSGALLYHNYNEPKNVKLFYYKRWKSLMPDFYVAFFCMYAVNVIVNRSFFYKGQPLTLLLTIIGQDGYLSGIIPNYYILGEWFLGAILILYVIYPLLVKAINKKEAIAVSIIVAMYILSLFIDALGINAFRSVFSCLISFTIGIVIEKHRIYEHRWLAVPALIGFVVENFFIKNAGSNVSAHIGGALLFFVLFSVGGLVYRWKVTGAISDFISNISYDMFLIHHVAIIYILKVIDPFDSLLMNVVYMLADIVLIIIVSVIFSKIMKRLLRTKAFRKFDGWMMRKVGAT